MSLKMAKLKSAFHILKQQKILYKIRLILNAEDENSRFPSAFFFMYQVHERKKKLSYRNLVTLSDEFPTNIEFEFKRT